MASGGVRKRSRRVRHKPSTALTVEDFFTIKMQNVGDDLIQTVDAERLHEWLGVGTDFRHWIVRRIDDASLVESVDFVQESCRSNLSGKTDGNEVSNEWGGSNKIAYHLSLDAAKRISMMEKGDKGNEGGGHGRR